MPHKTAATVAHTIGIDAGKNDRTFMTTAAAVLRNTKRKSTIVPAPSRTGDRTMKGTPEDSSTDSNRRSRSLTRSSARARSMNTAALRAQMSAIRISRSDGRRGAGKSTPQHAEDFAVTADQRRRMHRADSRGAKLVAMFDRSRIRLDIRYHDAIPIARPAVGAGRRASEADARGDGHASPRAVISADESLRRRSACARKSTG